MRGRKCFFPGCTTRDTVRKGLTLFKFPTDRRRYNEWLDACKKAAAIVSSTISFASFRPNNAYICELHFEDHMFSNFDKTRLFPHAKPTVAKISKFAKGHKHARNTGQTLVQCIMKPVVDRVIIRPPKCFLGGSDQSSLVLPTVVKTNTKINASPCRQSQRLRKRTFRETSDSNMGKDLDLPTSSSSPSIAKRALYPLDLNKNGHGRVGETVVPKDLSEEKQPGIQQSKDGNDEVMREPRSTVTRSVNTRKSRKDGRKQSESICVVPVEQTSFQPTQSRFPKIALSSNDPLGLMKEGKSEVKGSSKGSRVTRSDADQLKLTHRLVKSSKKPERKPQKTSKPRNRHEDKVEVDSSILLSPLEILSKLEKQMLEKNQCNQEIIDDNVPEAAETRKDIVESVLVNLLKKNVEKSESQSKKLQEPSQLPGTLANSIEAVAGIARYPERFVVGGGAKTRNQLTRKPIVKLVNKKSTDDGCGGSKKLSCVQNSTAILKGNWEPPVVVRKEGNDNNCSSNQAQLGRNLTETEGKIQRTVVNINSQTTRERLKPSQGEIDISRQQTSLDPLPKNKVQENLDNLQESKKSTYSPRPRILCRPSPKRNLNVFSSSDAVSSDTEKSIAEVLSDGKTDTSVVDTAAVRDEKLLESGQSNTSSPSKIDSDTENVGKVSSDKVVDKVVDSQHGKCTTEESSLSVKVSQTMDRLSIYELSPSSDLLADAEVSALTERSLKRKARNAREGTNEEIPVSEKDTNQKSNEQESQLGITRSNGQNELMKNSEGLTIAKLYEQSIVANLGGSAVGKEGFSKTSIISSNNDKMVNMLKNKINFQPLEKEKFTSPGGEKMSDHPATKGTREMLCEIVKNQPVESVPIQKSVGDDHSYSRLYPESILSIRRTGSKFQPPHHQLPVPIVRNAPESLHEVAGNGIKAPKDETSDIGQRVKRHPQCKKAVSEKTSAISVEGTNIKPPGAAASNRISSAKRSDVSSTVNSAPQKKGSSKVSRRSQTNNQPAKTIVKVNTDIPGENQFYAVINSQYNKIVLNGQEYYLIVDSSEVERNSQNSTVEKTLCIKTNKAGKPEVVPSNCTCTKDLSAEKVNKTTNADIAKAKDVHCPTRQNLASLNNKTLLKPKAKEPDMTLPKPIEIKEENTCQLSSNQEDLKEQQSFVVVRNPPIELSVKSGKITSPGCLSKSTDSSKVQNEDSSIKGSCIQKCTGKSEGRRLSIPCDTNKIVSVNEEGAYIVVPQFAGSKMSWVAVQDPNLTYSKVMSVPQGPAPIESYGPMINGLNMKVDALKFRVAVKTKKLKNLAMLNKRLRSRLEKAKQDIKEKAARIRSMDKHMKLYEHLTPLAKQIVQIPHGTGHSNLGSIPGDVKEFSLGVYSRSPEAYAELREVFPVLPHKSTLHRWFRSMVKFSSQDHDYQEGIVEGSPENSLPNSNRTNFQNPSDLVQHKILSEEFDDLCRDLGEDENHTDLSKEFHDAHMDTDKDDVLDNFDDEEFLSNEVPSVEVIISEPTAETVDSQVNDDR